MKVDAVLITGPTASGKSAVALDVAAAIGGAIVNTDSMQVYRQLRILTARPDDAEMARVPHHLFGHVGVEERYSAGRYGREAAETLADLRARGRIPLFVGGTGLYFSVLTEGIAEIPPVPAAVAAAASAKLNEMGNAAFHAMVMACDPQTGARLAPGDSQRLLRAYSVFQATGRPLSDWQKGGAAPVLAGLKLARFVLNPPRPTLHARIAARFAAMLAQGVVEEVRALPRPDPALPAARILGLAAIRDFADGRIGREAMEETVVTATRQYAKRQVTWYRKKMAGWQWIESEVQRNIISEIMSQVA
jgi:tRNA dimethylallyltransferase